MNNVNKKDFFHQMELEQHFYDHSLKAKILGYDSYMLSRYLYHLRMVEWHETTLPICGIGSWWDGINLECASMGV